MNINQKYIKSFFLIILDSFLLPFTFISAIWFKFIRTRILGLWHAESRVSLFVFRFIGVFPISNSFYEPLFNTDKLKIPLNQDRKLPGIFFFVNDQINLLKSFNFSREIIDISKLSSSNLNYSFNKGSFLSGDSEVLYSFIRFLKPKKIIEIGCGQSSLMIQHAIKKNCQEDTNDYCEHICIEPYPNSLLYDIEATVIKQKVEDIDINYFDILSENDILFIDSSHIIRAQGDVLFEYLQLLPSLNKGVYIHIHDIFTPRDYLESWLQNGINFWNEQYLFEAFMSNNNDFKIVLALNFLKNNHYQLLKSCCPMLDLNREPGSMWIKKIN
jgi:hypothetical protein